MSTQHRRKQKHPMAAMAGNWRSSVAASPGDGVMPREKKGEYRLGETTRVTKAQTVWTEVDWGGFKSKMAEKVEDGRRRRSGGEEDKAKVEIR